MRAATDRLRTKFESDGDDISLKPLSWWRQRWADKAIQRLFIENFIYIRSGKDGNQLTRLILNDVQLDFLEHCSGNDAILKSRQQGLSTIILALKFAKAILFSGTNLRLVPHDPDAEEEFWNRVDVMYQNLPPHLRPGTKYFSKEEILIQDVAKGVRDSRITTLSPTPGKEDKGRGQTLTDLHLSEVPFWKGDQRKTLNSLLTAAQHGDVTVESTAQGMEWFYQTYSQGKRPGSRFKSHFYEWWWTREYKLAGAKFLRSRNREWILLMPHETLKDVWSVPSSAISEDERVAKRNRFDKAKLTKEEFQICGLILAHLKSKGYVAKLSKWYCDEVAEYIAWRRKKINDLPEGEIGFKVEYPENDADCFENTGRSVIAPRWLKVTCEPQEPIDGHRYLIAADTSLGNTNGDPAAVQVIDLDTGRQCFSETLFRSPDLLAFRLVELSDQYNWAMIAVERNNTGIATVKKLNELVEPERIYKELTRAALRAVEDGTKTLEEATDEAEGGIMTTAANKGVMGVYLEQAIRTGEIGLSSQAFCDEAKTVVWTANDKWSALPGFHDDQFMALAIANYVRVQVMAQSTGFVGAMPETGYAR